MIEVTFNAIITIQNFIQIHHLVQRVYPPQKFECLPLWNSWSYEIKEYVTEVAFNVITSIQNFIQIHQLVQKLHPPQMFNVRHFGMVEATELNSSRGNIQCHQLIQNFIQSTCRFKSCSHLRSLYFRHFGIKLRHWTVRSRGHRQCHHLHTRFRLNPPIGSDVKGFFAPISEV
jgi:hypothetical protein